MKHLYEFTYLHIFCPIPARRDMKQALYIACPELVEGPRLTRSSALRSATESHFVGRSATESSFTGRSEAPCPEEFKEFPGLKSSESLFGIPEGVSLCGV